MFQSRHIFNKWWLLIASTLFSVPALAEEFAKYNLPTPAATITQEIFDLHTLTATVATVIMIIVTGIIVYALVKFRKSAGYEADQNFNESWFGRWSWVLVPAIVLGIDFSVAGPAAKVLAEVETYDDADVTVKVVGSQWKWTYEYMDDGVKIVSNLNKNVPETDILHLRDVDNRLVLPTGKRIRFLHTATDVLHAWWVPAIAYKKDSIPGYINETWTVIEKEGTYRGQCAENCGTGHAYMPIVVDAVSPAKYDEWMNGQKVAMAAAAAEANADKTWSLAELMERGEKVYNANCVACHQATGMGIPNVFPALKGSKMALEDMPAHMDMVIHGSKKNPVMAAWGKQLNDLELAAVITYERNAWGNDTGDVVQPADVKAAR
jgi:cytochrome c oxidase subunit 2